MLRRRIPFVRRKAVAGVDPIVLLHQSVSRGLGHDRGRRDAGRKCVAVNNPALRGRTARDGSGINEHVVGARAESFDACRFLIDRLKAETAIWKKEVWSDGTGTWVHP